MEESIANWVRNLPDHRIEALMKVMTVTAYIHSKIPANIKKKLIEALVESGELSLANLPTREEIDWFESEFCKK